MNQSFKQKDLPNFVGAFDIPYQKEKESATSNGDQSNTPEADDVDIGDVYYNGR
ncbi:hypothetical protein BH18THE2_BH18THE2_34640 [soil metagenome]